MSENLSARSTARRIELLRNRRCWTQIQLAEEMARRGVRITSAWISELEDDKKNRAPSMKVLVALAKALRTTTDFLLLLTNDPNPNQPIVSRSPEADEAGMLMDSLPDESWRKVALLEMRKVIEEWQEIERQDRELTELVQRVEQVGGDVAATIVEDYIASRLTLLSRGRGDTANEIDGERANISQ